MNNTGLPVHIASMQVSWGAAPPNLVQALLNSVSIWNGSSAAPSGFPVPTATQPWTLPTGQNSVLEVRFTATASNIRITITFQETDCPPFLDSSTTYTP